MKGNAKQAYRQTCRICREDLGEFVGQIIDVFEDFLDERGVIIPNDDRDCDPNVNPEEAANIYGVDYGELSGELQTLLTNWGLVSEPDANPNL